MKAKKTLLAALFSIALSGTLQSYAQVEGDPQENDYFGSCVATGDFNGDGKDDLAIGVSGESISGVEDVGAVNVLYGSAPNGLTSTGDQFWNQSISSVEGDPEAGDRFGSSLAVGDFNGDGYDDLAIGVPYEAVGSEVNAGAVNILYGSSVGLTATGDQIWDQNKPNVEGKCEDYDYFGSSLASGDFDGDGYDDLAIGVHFEAVGSVESAGAVNVLYGSSVGLTATGDQIWDQDKSGVEGACEEWDEFGSSLASGDFDGDGYDDLAIGVRGETIGSVLAGGVNILYGSSAGLTSTGDQFWDQNKPNVEGACEEFDGFGYSLASGDFDGDGYDDLAIGVVGEAIGTVYHAGGVNVLYGSSGTGLTATGDQFWDQNKSGVEGACEELDQFGFSLASGDFDGDGYDDLAIGVESEAVSTIEDAGAVNVLYGSSVGLSASGDQIWDQNKSGVEDASETGDHFGWSVASGDFGGDGKDDIAIGVPFEGVGTIDAAGAVNVLYGSSGTGLTATGDQIWDQGSSLIRLDGDESVNSSFSVYPNPAGSQTLLHFSLEQRLQVSIKVFDVNGREIQSVLNDILDQGDHTLALNTSGFPKGVYIVQLITNGGIENQKLMVQ